MRIAFYMKQSVISSILILTSFIVSAGVSITPMQFVDPFNPTANHTVSWTASGASSCGFVGSFSSSSSLWGGGTIGGGGTSPFRVDAHSASGSKLSSTYAYGRSLDVYVNTEVSTDTRYIYKVYAYTCINFSGSYVYVGEASVVMSPITGTDPGDSSGGGNGGGGNGGGDNTPPFTNGTPPPNVTFVHTDLLGSPVAETDENGDKK